MSKSSADRQGAWVGWGKVVAKFLPSAKSDVKHDEF